MGSSKQFSNRRFVIGGIVALIIIIYIARLFSLQVMSDKYKISAESNALYKEIIYPYRGQVLDRNGELLVYNEPSYNIMVVMQEQVGVDTAEFCKIIGITPEVYVEKMAEIKAKRNYSRYTPQIFMAQIPAEEFSVIREKLSRFKGFSFEKRSSRRYATPHAAHILGDVGEVNEKEIANDEYYKNGDIIGKLGIERSYEKQLRGQKGMKVLLRDVRGRIKGRFEEGKHDKQAVPGSDITLTIDMKLQALAERLLEGKVGSIVAIEPKTGEVLCMASSPTYDPNLLVGRDRGKNHQALKQNPRKPMLNRAVMGTYPPGSTFKITQTLIGLQEGIITPEMRFPCSRGFNYKGLHVGCHGHAAPIALVPAIATSCNSYFCWNLYRMFDDRTKYKTVQEGMTRWKDHLVAMGYGYKLGIDLPSEARGMIPNADYYDKYLGKKWNGLTVISISIGQGEVTSTPLQIANLGAMVANRGYFYTPHVVKKIQGGALDTLYTKPRRPMIDEKWFTYAVDGMRSAVTGGTCKGANIPGLDVCGKTGTAQNRGQDHSAFMGFAPKDDPRIAVAVYIENGGFGATFAVPIGALIIEQYLNGELSSGSQARANSLQARKISYPLYDK